MSMRGRAIRCTTATTNSGTGDWESYVDWHSARYESIPDFDSPATSSGVGWYEWLKWKNTHGTVYYGNLPQHTKHEHVGYSWMPCPYDNNSNLDLDPDTGNHTLRRRHLLGGTPSQAVDHSENNKRYYMRPTSRGARWGFECSFDDCPYYINSGRRYFYT